ncbi:CDAN1 protein, partial [Polypterus senegalus]
MGLRSGLFHCEDDQLSFLSPRSAVLGRLTVRTWQFTALATSAVLMPPCSMPNAREFRKLLAAFVAGSSSKNGGLIRKITPTAAEPFVPCISLSQQKLQIDLEQAFFHNQPPSLRRTVEFVAERVGSNCVKHIKATLVADTVQSGEVIMKEKLKDDGEHLKNKLLDAVLKTAQDIAIRMATEKACTWLAANITALTKRELKSAYDRLVKAQRPTGDGEAETSREFLTLQMSKLEENGVDCPVGCEHKVSLPSELIIALKFILPVPEQMLARCTVMLACELVSGQLPLLCSELHADERTISQTPTRMLLRQLLNLWKENFHTLIPFQLLFSNKNVASILEASSTEWGHFLYLMCELQKQQLLAKEEVKQHLEFLQSSSWPMALLKSLISYFMKREVLDNIKTPVHMLKIDLLDKTLHLPLKEVDLGFATKQALEKASEKLLEKPLPGQQFRRERVAFLSTTAKKLLDKCPLNYAAVRHMACLDPVTMINDEKRAISMFEKLLQLLLNAKWHTAADCDQILSEYKMFLTEMVQHHKEEFQGYRSSSCRLDTFMGRFAGDKAVRVRNCVEINERPVHIVTWARSGRKRVLCE